MPDPTFDLTSSPFYQLGVTARDGLDRIAEAAEEAEASGRLSSQIARDAQRQLATSRPRLAAELQWLPGVHPEAAALLVDALAHRRPAKARAILPQLPGLARANVAAHLLGSGSDADPPLNELIAAQALVTADDIERRVNGERTAAGLPLVTRDLVAAGLSDVAELHARAAVDGLLRQSDAAETLVSVLRDNRDDTGGARALLERIVDRFDTAAAPRVAETEEEIDAATQAIRAEPGDTAALERLKAGIMLWSRLTMPRRSISGRLGIDDKRSSEFLKRQRDLCLALANDHKAHASALDVTRLLGDLFADQKGWAARLADDAAMLEEHVAAERSGVILDPLTQAIEAAHRAVAVTIEDLSRAGFGPGRTGAVGDLYRAFAAAAAASETLGAERDLPWLLLRQLAASLHNDHKRPDAAFNLIDGVLCHVIQPTSRVRELLDHDRSVLALERDLTRAGIAAAAGRFLEARGIMQRLIEQEPDPDRRKTLEAGIRAIAAREAQQRNRRIGWAVAACIAFVVYLASQTSQAPPNPAPSPAYAPPPSGYSPSSPAPPNAAAGVEMMPPVQSGEHLSRDQLRWCQFNDERLEAARAGLVEDSQVYRFNEVVDDWNSRCARYRYWPADLEAVRTERARNASRLRDEGARLATSWNLPPRQNAAALGPPPSTVRPQPLPTMQPGLIEQGLRLLSTTDSDDIATIQDRLRDLGFFSGRSTGNFGPVTRNALREWGRRNGFGAAAAWNVEVQRALFRGTGL